MSLINEALKKAQQQRSGSGFHMSLGRLASASESGSNQSIMLKLIIGLILMAVILGASLSILFYGIWQGKQTENPPVAAAAPTTEPDAVAAIQPTAQAATAAPQPAQATVTSYTANQPRQAVVKSPPPALEVNTSTPPPLSAEVSGQIAGKELSVTPSVGETAPAASPSSVQSVPKPDKQVMAYIRMLNVNAVRMAGNDSKVFMNNEIFRLNSTVNSDLKIKILKINPKQIVFIDNAGIKYIKRF